MKHTSAGEGTLKKSAETPKQKPQAKTPYDSGTLIVFRTYAKRNELRYYEPNSF